jgi:PilZ domain-containing protein
MSPDPDLTRIPATCERRSPLGFPVSAPLTYSVARSHGRGTTCNISNEDVLVKIDEGLPVGSRIQLLIDWPARLNGNLRLQVAVEGSILRSTAEGTAVKILEYEYGVHPRISSAQ